MVLRGGDGCIAVGATVFKLTLEMPTAAPLHLPICCLNLSLKLWSGTRVRWDKTKSLISVTWRAFILSTVSKSCEQRITEGLLGSNIPSSRIISFKTVRISSNEQYVFSTPVLLVKYVFSLDIGLNLNKVWRRFTLSSTGVTSVRSISADSVTLSSIIFSFFAGTVCTSWACLVLDTSPRTESERAGLQLRQAAALLWSSDWASVRGLDLSMDRD